MACMMFVGAMAFHGTSKLKIRAWDNSSFQVVLNNQCSAFNNFFRADNLAPGRHHVKIIKRYQSPYSCGPVTRVLHNGYIDIPQHSVVRANFRPNCGLTITDIRPLPAPSCPNPNGVNGTGYGTNGGNGWGTNGGFNGDFNHHGNGQGQGNGFGNPNGQGYGMGNGNSNGWNDGDFYENANGGFGMNNHRFQDLKIQLRNTAFDNDKLRIANQAVRANGITSQQVREIMEMMSFESTRLKFAKASYQFTVDRQNYYTVNSAFNFSSSVRELERYIYRFS